jgi:PAS domain S-box-containing protein
MTAGDFLGLFIQLFFLSLCVLTIRDYVRRSSPVRRDVALLITSLAGPSLILIVLKIVGEESSRAAVIVNDAALVFEPYLLLRLVGYLRPISRRLIRFSLFGMIYTGAAVLIFEPDIPPLIGLPTIAYFGAANLYAMRIFIRGALQTSGVVRHRLRFAASGSGLLALLVALLLATLIPDLKEFATFLVLITVIACICAFYAAFAPPRWLRRAWQNDELNKHLHYIGSITANGRPATEQVMEAMCQAANRMVNGIGAAIARLNPDTDRWELAFADGMRLMALPESISFTHNWNQRTAKALQLSETATKGDREVFESADADTLLTVPVPVNGSTGGMLMVFLAHGSLFIEDDLALLSLLASQSAIFMENSLLVTRLQAYSQGLEQQVQAGASALQESEDRYHNILDNMLEGCQIITKDWRYLYINDAAAQYGRQKKDDLLGYTLMERYPGIETTEMFAELKTCMDTRMPRHLEFEFNYPDGGSAWFEFSVQPVPEGIFILSLDITERKRALEKLEDENEELEKRVAERTNQLQAAIKELEAFSYSVSHDLRAPLRAMDGFGQALEEGYDDVLDDMGKNYLSRIRAAASRMGQLIDDLLELSRLTRSEMGAEAVNLSTLALQIATDLIEQYPGRKVAFDVEDGLTAQGDPRLLRVALTNLLGNAWKYTSQEAEARVEFGRTTYNDRPAFYVRDNGAGFDMAYADKLFGVFQRLHATRDFPGTGIGLATVQRIIQRHGGEIWADGKVNEGATFYFSL